MCHLNVQTRRHACAVNNMSAKHGLVSFALAAYLVSSDGHAHLVADTQQQQAALSAVDCDLTDELVKALGIELFTNRADAGLTCLQI